MSDIKEPGVLVGGDDRQHRFVPSRRLAILVALVVVLVASLVGYLLLKPGPATPRVDVDALLTQANKLASDGEYTQAFLKYDEAAQGARTDSKRTQVYTAEVNAAMTGKKYDVVIAAGNKLLAIDKTSANYAIIASAYQAKGDKANAIDFYRKAIDAFNASKPHNTNAPAREYEIQIATLKGSP